MGRKLPSKRHHGVKDPIQQNERRNAKLKMKINETPANIDDQEVPKKLKNLFKPVKKFKSGLDEPRFMIDKRGKAIVDGKPELSVRPVKKVPKIERKPGESDRELLWRAEVTTRQYMKTKKFENKYDVDIETDSKTGEVKVKSRDKTFEEEEMRHFEPKTKLQKKKAKKIEKLQKEREERRKARLQRFKERKQYKKNKNKDEFSVLKQDKVEFGDVAQQPPAITAKPRKSADLERPGEKRLLLKTLIATEKPSNLTGKRKDLPALDRQRLEAERQRAVDLYREMQKQKHANKDTIPAQTAQV